MHPPRAVIESLVHKELPPRHRPIRIQPRVARHLQLRPEEEGSMRIDQQQCMMPRGIRWCNRKSVRPTRLPLSCLHAGHRYRRRLPFIKFLQPTQIHLLNIAANTALGKRERHPRLKPHQYPRLHLRMSCQVEVEAIRPGIHQALQPRRRLRILLLQILRIDKQPLPQILPHRLLALRLRRAAQRGQVIRLHPRKVVLALRIDHPEDRIRVRAAMHMRDAPIIPRNADGLRLVLPARRLRRLRKPGTTGKTPQHHQQKTRSTCRHSVLSIRGCLFEKYSACLVGAISLAFQSGEHVGWWGERCKQSRSIAMGAPKF